MAAPPKQRGRLLKRIESVVSYTARMLVRPIVKLFEAPKVAVVVRLDNPEFSSVVLAEAQPIVVVPAEVVQEIEQVVEVVEASREQPAEPAPVAVHARPRTKRKPKAKRRVVSFQKMIKNVADRHGVQAAATWTRTVLRYQREINTAALETAIASGNVDAIAAVVGPDALQKRLQEVMTLELSGIAATAGRVSVQLLSKHGINATFNAVHPNVVRYARERAAEMVVGVAVQTKQVIAEVVARGAAGLLTVDDQARAIREVVGLPPNYAKAPRALVEEIKAGDAAAATSRRLSATAKQQIRSRIKNGTVSRTFLNDIAEQYSASLVNLRAHTIARTESLRASHFGVHESWKQMQSQGLLPTTVRRIWMVTEDDRLSEEHALIPSMNPNGRRMDEPFVTPDGPCMYPPSRPNCRCSVALSFAVPATNQLSPQIRRTARKGKAVLQS